MGKIAGDGDVAFVDSVAPGGLQTREQSGVAIGLRIVLAAGVERAGAQWNGENVIGAQVFSLVRFQLAANQPHTAALLFLEAAVHDRERAVAVHGEFAHQQALRAAVPSDVGAVRH
jgi:hypothetical protein